MSSKECSSTSLWEDVASEINTRWNQVYCQTKETCGGSDHLKGAVLPGGRGRGLLFNVLETSCGWRAGSVGKALATQMGAPRLGLQKPHRAGVVSRHASVIPSLLL